MKIYSFVRFLIISFYFISIGTQAARVQAFSPEASTCSSHCCCAKELAKEDCQDTHATLKADCGCHAGHEEFHVHGVIRQALPNSFSFERISIFFELPQTEELKTAPIVVSLPDPPPEHA